MLNHDQKLKYSIGVDSLALLCAKEIYDLKLEWNVHENINYAEKLQMLGICIAIKKHGRIKAKEEYSECEYRESDLNDAKNKIESVFREIRNDLNGTKRKLVIEQVDTKECDSIRVTIESAIIWAEHYLELDISSHFPDANATDKNKYNWKPGKTKNCLEYVAALFEILSDSNIYQSKNKKIALTDSLVTAILGKCKNEKSSDKTRTIRNLYNDAMEIMDDRNPTDKNKNKIQKN